MEAQTVSELTTLTEDTGVQEVAGVLTRTPSPLRPSLSLVVTPPPPKDLAGLVPALRAWNLFN